MTRRAVRPHGGHDVTYYRADGSEGKKSWGHKVDLFASDVVGKRFDGSHVYAQATCGKIEAVRVRRRKLEKIPWHESDTVLVLQLVEEQDPRNARRKLFHFRVHEYNRWLQEWGVREETILVPREWFKALKREEPAFDDVPAEGEPAF